MDSQDAIDIGRQAIAVSLMIGAPVLIIGMVIGLGIGLLQALTQIQDQTVSFVPKIVAMFIALGFCLPWLIQMMSEYSEELIVNIPRLVTGG